MRRFRRTIIPGKTGQDDKHCKHMPTGAEIADECKQIQAGWSAAERWRRLGQDGPPEPMTVPMV